MENQSSNRVLLVGATGYAGEQLAHYLLQETDATVILAGRSRVKLENLHTGLLQRHPADRLEILGVDAANFISETLVDFDLLINATNEGPHNASLITAEEGGDQHCQVGRIDLATGEILDWLDSFHSEKRG